MTARLTVTLCAAMALIGTTGVWGSAASAQTRFETGSTSQSMPSSATYQRGATALPDLSAERIAADVVTEYNPRTGAPEAVAPTFDPFEDDPRLAASVNLRGTDAALDLDRRTWLNGALLEIALYYTDTGERGFGRTRDAVFLNGEPAPIVYRDSRELECSARVTETIYVHDRFYSAGHGGLFRTRPTYWGHRGFGHRGFGHPDFGYRGFGHRGSGYRDFHHRNRGYGGRWRHRDDGHPRYRPVHPQPVRPRPVRPRPEPRPVPRIYPPADVVDEMETLTGTVPSGTRLIEGSDGRIRPRTGPRRLTNNPPARQPDRSQRRSAAEPRPAPRARPDAAPRSIARPTTRPASRPTPRPTPRPAPRVDPRPRALPQPRGSQPRVPQLRADDRLQLFPTGGTDTVVLNTQRDCAREDRLVIFVPDERLEAARFDGLTLVLRDVSVDPRTHVTTIYDERALYVPPNYVAGFRIASGRP